MPIDDKTNTDHDDDVDKVLMGSRNDIIDSNRILVYDTRRSILGGVWIFILMALEHLCSITDQTSSNFPYK